MKKKIFLSVFALVASLTISAQFNTAEYLDINNVKARFMVHGDMFWDPSTGDAAYEFSKGSGKHSNFVSSIWIGGIDQSTNSLKVAAQTYRQSGNDYWPGPLDEFNGASIDSTTSANWAQIWKVNKSTIDSFRQLTTITLTNTPKSILRWPGRMNPHAVTPSNTILSIPNREMAPFIDINNDMVYNPLDGDYPNVKGDQMLFWVFNDKAGNKSSGSDAIGLEIHGTAYACKQKGLQNTTFVNLRVHNWSTSILDSTFVGIFNDADLGYAFDDYIGYDTTYSMGVTYNGDSFDESAAGYGNNLTQTGILFVRGPRIDNPQFPIPGSPQFIELPASSFSFFYNGTNSKTGSPIIANEFYNYLSGKWRDGSPIMAGCMPEATMGTPTNFVFPDDPSIANGISEKVCNRTPFDRKTLISSGPFMLIPGIVPSDITFAIVNTDTGVNNNNFNELRRLADSAYKYSEGCQSISWPVGLPAVTEGNLRVYPNPANSFFTIEDSEPKKKYIQLFNVNGQVVYKEESNSQRININTQQLPSGLYFLRIEKGKDQFSQHILIK